MTGYADPAGHGAGRVGFFTVLYDEGCPICRTARRWLAGRTQLVPLVFVPAGSAEARARFPGLDHTATLRDLTVIADDGRFYVGDGAWLACLWALADYRGTAERLASPHLLPAARRFIAAASAVRASTRSPEPESTRSPEPESARSTWPESSRPPEPEPTRSTWPESTRSTGPDETQPADYGGQCDDRCR